MNIILSVKRFIYTLFIKNVSISQFLLYHILTMFATIDFINFCKKYILDIKKSRLTAGVRA